jgi:hypothetical protein
MQGGCRCFAPVADAGTTVLFDALADSVLASSSWSFKAQRRLYRDPIVLDTLFFEPYQRRNGWRRGLDRRRRCYRGVCRGASASATRPGSSNG